MGHRFRKAVLQAGRTYVTRNGTPLHATPERLQGWVDKFKKIRAKKVLTPVSWGHNSQAEPICEDAADANEYWKSALRAGSLDDLEYNADEGMLYAVGDVPAGDVDESGNIFAWTRLPDGREVKTAVNEVSIAVSKWRDGDGVEWDDVPIHLALCVLPVGHGMAGFKKHDGPKMEMSITAVDEPLYLALSMADPVKPKTASPQKQQPSAAAAPKQQGGSASQPGAGGSFGKPGWLPLFQQPQNKTAAPPSNEPAVGGKPQQQQAAQPPMPAAPPPPKPDFHGLTDWNKVEEHNQKYGMPSGMAHTLGQVAPGLPKHLQGVPTSVKPFGGQNPQAQQAPQAQKPAQNPQAQQAPQAQQQKPPMGPNPFGGQNYPAPQAQQPAQPHPPGTASLTGAQQHQPAPGPAPASQQPAQPNPAGIASQHAPHVKAIMSGLRTSSRVQVRKAVQAAQQAGMPAGQIKQIIHRHALKSLGPNPSNRAIRQAKKRARFMHSYATTPGQAKIKAGKVQSAFGGQHLHKDLEDINQKFDTAEQAHKAQGQYEQQAAQRAKSVADEQVKSIMGDHKTKSAQHQFVWNLVHWIASKIPYAGPLRAALRRLHGKQSALMGQDHAARLKVAKQEMAKANIQSRMAEHKHKAHAQQMKRERAQRRNEKRAEHREGRAWEKSMGLLSTFADFSQWALHARVESLSTLTNTGILALQEKS